MRNARRNGGIVDHLFVLTYHWDTAKARVDDQESFLGLVHHAGRDWSRSGELERSARTL